MNKLKLGKKIKERRLKYGMTQEDLADELKVRVGYISIWENDHLRPSIDNLKKLAKAFGITIDELVS